jgi:tetratricopeptide (TPR) repeat protein
MLPGTARAQRQPFIDHLIAFRSLLFGTYGDEGARVSGELQQLSIALAAWDEAIRAREQSLNAAGASAASRAEQRSSLAALMANRGRIGAALFEIEAALAVDPARRQLLTLRGRLLEAYRYEAEAGRAYRRAWELDRSDAINAYLALSVSSSSDSSGSAALPIDTLLDAGRRVASSADRFGPEPIRELQLIPDRSSKTPIFAPAAYADGFSALLTGNYADALNRFRAAVSRDPLIIDPASRSAVLSAGIAKLRTGMLREAIDLLESGASMFPDSSEVHRILGTAHSAVGNSSQAVEHLSRAVSLAPLDERSRLALAREFRDAGRIDDAERTLREALAVLPRSAEARWMLGDVLERTGHGLDGAREMEAAAAAIVLAGKAALYWRAAAIYDRHQDFERVVALLRRRVSLDPNNPVVHRQLGLVYARLGSRDEAFAELVMTDLLGGADAESLAAIGQIHLDTGRLADAESTARRAIAMQSDRQDARYVLGRALLRQGRTAEAREHLQMFQALRDRAMVDQRRTFEIDKLRAEAARQTAAGQYDEAASIWRRVVDMMPGVPDFHVAAAQALAAGGELEEAATHLEKAAALGDAPAVKLRLAELYAQLGRKEDSERARQAYEQDVKKLLKSTPR